MERLEGHPEIEVKFHAKGARAKWCGLMTCGHIWTCPVCSQNLRAGRAGKATHAVQHLGGRWQMLTVTLRHREGMSLKELLRGMSAAWRRTRQGGRIQRLWGERVSASIRATEITHGENGWHPHIHVLLRTTEWSEDDRDALRDRWEKAITKELGPECTPNDLHAMVWSEAWEAEESANREKYLAKLGLEIGGLAKEGRARSLSIWQVLALAAKGDQAMLRLWWEYSAGTRGRRMLELDDRAAIAAEQWLEANGHIPEGEIETREPLRIEVRRDDVRLLRKLEWHRHPWVFAALLTAAEQEGEPGVRSWIDYARRTYRPPPVDRGIQAGYTAGYA